MAAAASGSVEANATVIWADWGGEVRGGSALLRAVTATQPELGGPGNGTNPEELLAPALANCYTSTITSLARTRDIPLLSVETKSETRLAWNEERPHHIERGTLSVRISTSAPEQQVRELAHEARDHCPVCNMLGATATVTLSVSIAAGEVTAGR